MDFIPKTSESGCKNRKCPCRIWLNCQYYVDADTKKWGSMHSGAFFDEIHEWYDNSFRKCDIMPDAVPNG